MRLEETNLEALRAKKAAVQKGYMRDEFISHIIPEPTRRDFIMNRGYWSRSFVFRALVEKFAASGGKQVLSLGAGLDTLAFRTLKGRKGKLRFFECDLPVVTAQKAALLTQSPRLVEIVQDVAGEMLFGPETINSEGYVLFPADLNQPNELTNRFKAAGLRPELPTLVIAECVLIYLHPDSVPLLRNHLASYFTNICFADYEMLGSSSPFSRVMVQNFARSGIPLLALSHFSDLEKIRQAQLGEGFTTVQASTMSEIFCCQLNPEELRRICALEWADELEEFNLMQSHYFVSVAKNCTEGPCSEVALSALATYAEPEL